MTAILAPASSKTSLWNQMPGWGIVTDLTPAEVIAARSLRVIRRMIALLLALVVVGCAALYVWARLQNSAAEQDATSASAASAQLQSDLSKYSRVTSVQAATAQIQSQLAGVLSTDVDATHLLQSIRAALPSSMAIDNLTVSLTPQTAPTTTGADTTASIVGTVTITGTGKTIDDLAGFVERLSALPGVVDVVPGSNEMSEGVARFGLTLSLTSELYSHHFDLNNNSGGH